MCVDEENKMKKNSKKKKKNLNDPRNTLAPKKANRSLPIF